MIDHIHFQYNGFLFGIFLLSVIEIYQQNYLKSAFFFIVLLHFKHIFIYIAPAYGIFLLKFYCFPAPSVPTIFKRTFTLGLIVLGVTVISLGPFINQLPQLAQRLFPFKRGLSHAYWAPNFWALYNFSDKILSILFGVKTTSSSTTSGLVQTFDHIILPSISPLMTFLLTFVTIIPCILKLATVKVTHKDVQSKLFVQTIVLCAGSSFLFGWHVHEKAILLITIPMSLIGGKMSKFIEIVGFYSLFPLLFNPELTAVKTAMFLSYLFLSHYHWKVNSLNKDCLNIAERLYLTGFIPLYIYENFLHQLLGFNVKFSFLPLMLTSVYCSIGVVYFYCTFYYDFLFKTIKNVKNEKLKKIK